MNIDSLIYYPQDNTNNDIKYYHGVPAVTSSKLDPKKPLVIFYHGNACSSGQMVSMVQKLSDNYMIPEYPGYSGVGPCEEGTTVGIIRHVDALAEWLSKNKMKVHIIGQSIGTGPACMLADKLPRRVVSSLQLLSPFTTLSQVINDYSLFVGYLVPSYYYNNLACLKKLVAYCPINIYHGTDDTTISASHSETIQEHIGKSSNLKLYLLENVNHNNIWNNHVVKTISQFLD